MPSAVHLSASPVRGNEHIPVGWSGTEHRYDLISPVPTETGEMLLPPLVPYPATAYKRIVLLMKEGFQLPFPVVFPSLCTWHAQLWKGFFFGPTFASEL